MENTSRLLESASTEYLEDLLVALGSISSLKEDLKTALFQDVAAILGKRAREWAAAESGDLL